VENKKKIIKNKMYNTIMDLYQLEKIKALKIKE